MIKVGVFFGGTSVEHEVSIISALQAIHAIDKDKYLAVPVYITKKGDWYAGPSLFDIANYTNLESLLPKCQRVILARDTNGRAVLNKYPFGIWGSKTVDTIDVAFPVIHGTNGEDGVLQGLFEMAQVPYVGCDVLSSAVGMDKIIMKKVIRDSAIPITDFVWFSASRWSEDNRGLTEEVERKLGYPVIVKPANLGSSVGIGKASNAAELEEAINLAAKFSLKIIVEKMVENLQEVNCSVLGDCDHAEASVCEEVLSSKDILTYQDKYMTNAAKGMSGTNRIIPANLTEELTNRIQSLAIETFQTLGCSGVSRIDFLIDRNSGMVYVNEINTIPGSLSFYLWEPTNKSFSKLTSELIQLALKRDRDRSSIMFTYDTNILALQGKGGGSKGAKR